MERGASVSSAFLSIDSSPPSARNCATTSDEAPTTTGTITTPRPSWKGFKLVGDNIDYHIKPRYMRIE